MTKKRFRGFYAENRGLGISDTITYIDYFLETKEDVIEFLNILNALDKENQELKQNCKNYSWYRQYKTILNENEELQSNLEELQGICKQYENKLHELKKEKEDE